MVRQPTATCSLILQYETFGPQPVDVRVSINGEGWTVNKMRFTYFANTYARNWCELRGRLAEGCGSPCTD